MFLCDCKEAPSPDECSTAKHIEPSYEREQSAGLPGVWGRSLPLEKQIFLGFGVIAKRRHQQKMGPPPSRNSQFINADSMQGLLEFGADPFVLQKQNFLDFGGIPKGRHHQTNATPPSILSQFINVDRLQGLLKFGADPFVLKKQNFLISV